MVIKGPPGFCIDTQNSQADTDPAFVLLGNCAALGRGFNLQQPKVRALLTASVSDGGGEDTVAATMPTLDQFFRSDDGRAALSRSGDPETVQILDTFAQENSYYLHAYDSSAPIMPGAANEYWRSYFDIGDQIVAVSVIATTEHPLSPEQSLQLVKAFAAEIKSANGLDVPPESLPESTSVAAARPAQSPYETTDPGDYEEFDVKPQRPRRKINVVRTLQTIGLLRQLFM